MLLFLGRKAISGLGALAAVSVLTFTMLFFSSGNIARNILGDMASDEAIAAKEVELGLDQPLTTRLVDWASGAVRGDLGVSWFSQEPVTTAILNRLPITLAMVVIAIVLIGAVATLMGVAAAVKRGGLDRLVQIAAVVGAAAPGFIIGLLLVYVFAIQLGWFPAISTIRPGAGLSAWALTLTLPVVALVINGVASTAQQVRSAFIKQLELDYVRTLRSRGIGEREILLRHVLRSAAPAGLTVLSLQFIAMLGGVVIIEQIFAIPGLGQLAILATTRGDMPVVLGVVIYTVLMVVIVNLIIDLLNGWLNPKVRVS